MRKKSNLKFNIAIAKAWLAFYVGSLVLLSGFVLIIIVTFLYWDIINSAISEYLGLIDNFTYVITAIWAVIFSYHLILLGVYSKRTLKKRFVKPHPINIVLPSIFIALSIVVYVGLWELAGGERYLFTRFVESISLYLYIIIIGSSLFYLFFVVKSVRKLLAAREIKAKQSWMKVSSIITLASIAYGMIFSIPLNYVPINVRSTPLPEKPAIIAHRGNSHYAPENTIAALEAALELDVIGWEIDVSMSVDGIPFLLHDDDLQRTTNVESVFPGKKDQDACFFTYSELTQLDAGSWFVDKDPYSTILTGVVPRVVAEGYRGIKIPSLEQAINFTRENDMVLDLDLKSIPENHPYSSNFTNIVMSMLDAAGLGEKVWTSYWNAKSYGFTKTCYRRSVEEFHVSDCDLVNTGMKISNELLEEYFRAEPRVPVMVYTVDDTFIFSELWILGTTYIKTNRPWIFEGMKSPIWQASPGTYITGWIFIEVGGVALVLFLEFIVQKRKKLIKEKK